MGILHELALIPNAFKTEAEPSNGLEAAREEMGFWKEEQEPHHPWGPMNRAWQLQPGEGSLAGSPFPGPLWGVAQPMHSGKTVPSLGMPSNSCLPSSWALLGMHSPSPGTAPAL